MDAKSITINYHHLFQVVSQVLNLMKVKKMDTNETSNAMFAYGLEHIVRNKTFVKFGLVSNELLAKADIKQAVFMRSLTGICFVKCIQEKINSQKFQNILK